MSLEENLETYLKEKYVNEEKKNETKTDNKRFDDSSRFLWKPINCPHI